MRIARFLARCGVASRRKSEALVTAGRVKVNGEVARDLGRQIDPTCDAVVVDDSPVSLPREHTTLAFNKPRRVLVSRGDDRGRRTVYDMLPEEFDFESERLVYAGRLDYMSEGLLILSTNTELVQELTHPARHVEKEYLARLDGRLGAEELRRLRGGEVEIESIAVNVIDLTEAGRPGEPVYRVTIAEGRNRVVRRLFEAVGRRVDRLIRLRIGGYSLESDEYGRLEAGDWRILDNTDLALLAQNPRK